MSGIEPVILSCVNLKGGVGKTAVAVNFAAHCGRENLRTLLIDLDPQTNATLSCISVQQWEEHAAKKGTVANLLGVRQHTSAEGHTKTASEVTIPDALKGVDLIPSHLDLFTIDLDLSAQAARETLLRRAIKDIVGEYDIVILDCPPNLTIPTQNALAASTHYIVPVSLDFLSSLGIGLLLNRVKRFSEDVEKTIELAGIVMTRVGRTSYFRSQTAQTLRAAFKDLVFQSEIKERSAVAESAAKNVSIFEMGDKQAAAEFTAFGNELLEKLGIKK